MRHQLTSFIFLKDTMKKARFGLVGKDISYSFSKRYFTEKFSDLGLGDHSYENFDIANIEDFKTTIIRNRDLKGLNVTIPYKESIIPYLDELDVQAEEIGAVNTIKFKGSRLKGYNTDAYGFENTMLPYLKPHHTKALILGTGGASRAVAYVLKSLGISFLYVSRNPDKNQIGYHDLTESEMKEFTIIINCTPVGTYPNTEQQPEIPYKLISENHFLFDLIYNPEKTGFLKEGQIRGASVLNGFGMLQLQADRSWEIWHE